MKRLPGKAVHWMILATLAVAGCTTLDQGGGNGLLLRAINRSDEVLQDVLVRDADSNPRYFGYIGLGTPAPERTLQLQISFDSAFVIGWYANGKRDTTQLDLSKYKADAFRIKSISFCYLGKGRWSVVARDANEREIEPSPPAPAPRRNR